MLWWWWRWSLKQIPCIHLALRGQELVFWNQSEEALEILPRSGERIEGKLRKLHGLLPTRLDKRVKVLVVIDLGQVINRISSVLPEHLGLLLIRLQLSDLHHRALQIRRLPKYARHGPLHYLELRILHRVFNALVLIFRFDDWNEVREHRLLRRSQVELLRGYHAKESGAYRPHDAYEKAPKDHRFVFLFHSALVTRFRQAVFRQKLLRCKQSILLPKPHVARRIQEVLAARNAIHFDAWVIRKNFAAPTRRRRRRRSGVLVSCLHIGELLSEFRGFVLRFLQALEDLLVNRLVA